MSRKETRPAECHWDLILPACIAMSGVRRSTGPGSRVRVSFGDPEFGTAPSGIEGLKLL